MDEILVKPGDILFRTLGTHIRDCDYFIAIISIAYGKSENCLNEISLRSALKKHIIPIMLDWDFIWPLENTELAFMLTRKLCYDIKSSELLTNQGIILEKLTNVMS